MYILINNVMIDHVVLNKSLIRQASVSKYILPIPVWTQYNGMRQIVLIV